MNWFSVCIVISLVMVLLCRLPSLVQVKRWRTVEVIDRYPPLRRRGRRSRW